MSLFHSFIPTVIPLYTNHELNYVLYSDVSLSPEVPVNWKPVVERWLQIDEVNENYSLKVTQYIYLNIKTKTIYPKIS